MKFYNFYNYALLSFKLLFLFLIYIKKYIYLNRMEFYREYEMEINEINKLTKGKKSYIIFTINYQLLD